MADIYKLNKFTGEMDRVSNPDDLDARYVNVAGDTMTGPLSITPADGTAGSLLGWLTTGVNAYGVENRTYDLTGIGYGKYPDIHFLSNGALGNGFGLIESALLIGDTYAPGVVGQSLGFFQNATLATLLMTPEWNWDGLGSNRINVQNLNVTGAFSFVGNMALGGGSEIIIPQNSLIRFQGQNGYDTLTRMLFAGGNYSWQIVNETGHALGFNGEALIVPSGRIAVDNGSGGGSYHYIDLNVNDGAVRMYYSGYVSSVGENSGCTAHYFTATGSDLPVDGWFMRGYHMTNYGHIFGITPSGDLEIGSTDGSLLTDYDTYLKFRGATKSGQIYWRQSKGVLDVLPPIARYQMFTYFV